MAGDVLVNVSRPCGRGRGRLWYWTMATLRPTLPGLVAGWVLAGLAGGLPACTPAPLEVPVQAWTRTWPAGELPDGVVGCLVIQQPRELFTRLDPALAALGLRPSAAGLDPSGRGLTMLSGAVWLDPERFDVPMVMAFDISDPDRVVAWQRRLRQPLAAVGATSVWAPRGFDADSVFRSGARAIPDHRRSMLYLRLTPRRLLSAFDPVSLGLSSPYLLGQPALGHGPAARLRVRPDRLHGVWREMFPDARQFWSVGAAELQRRLAGRVPDWVGWALAAAASLVADVRWIELDLVLATPGPHLTARLRFEAESAPARWLAGLDEDVLEPSAVCTALGLDGRLGPVASRSGVSVRRQGKALILRVPVSPPAAGS